MKLRTLLSLFTFAALAVAPLAHAKKPESAGKPAGVEKTEKAGKVEEAVSKSEKAEEKVGEVKGVSREEYKKLNAAREKADQDEAVKAAFAKKSEAEKAHVAAKKEGDAAKIAETKKAQQASHEAWIAARRAAIGKADPEAAKLDAQVFDNMKALREAKARKDAGESAEKPEVAEKGEGKGKGLETAPGQLKKEHAGEGKAHGKGKRKGKSEGDAKSE